MNLDRDIAAQLDTIAGELVEGPRSVQAPKQLLRAVERVRRLFDKGQSARISQDRVDKAVRALEASGAKELRPAQRFILANALVQAPAVLQGESILESRFAPALLSKWDEDSRAGKMRASHWRGLFHSYLQAAPSEHLERLRRVLRSSLPVLAKATKVRARWMETALRHETLLSENPCSNYVQELHNGARSRLDDLTQEISIPQASWFWRNLAETYCRHLELLSDSDFYRRIEFSLELAEELLLSHRDAVLRGVLNRYAQSSHRPRHNRLLEFSLEAWRSPQLSSSVAWTQVRPEAKQMVCAWLAEQDLRDFYELCQGDHRVDEDRLEYWLRFKHQISFTQIALGTDLQESSAYDARDFRNRHKGRLAYLTSRSRSNNAMLMQIGNWLFVEFSEKNNACFGYRMASLPFKLGAQVYAVDDLKSREVERLKGCKLIHRKGVWQQEIFDPALRQRGIRPDPEEVVEARVRPRIPAAIAAAIPPRLLGDIHRAGGKVTDNRPDGGLLLVRLPVPNTSIDVELRRIGFRWSRDAGYWLE